MASVRDIESPSLRIRHFEAGQVLAPREQGDHGMRFTSFLAIILAAMAVEAEAIPRTRVETVVGCVEQRAGHGHYELTVRGSTGKISRRYELEDRGDVSAALGQRVRAHGTVVHGKMAVSSLQTLSPLCPEGSRALPSGG
jgi:hypothetical protein